MDLKEAIKEKRPNLSASSITTYNSILKNLYKRVFGSEDIDIKKFEDTDKILEHIKDLPPNKRKTILSSLVIITNNNKKYKDLMLDDIKDYNKEIGKQEKSETQEENWVETAEIKEVWENLKRNAELLYKKKDLKPNDLQQIQSFIIVSMLGGIFVPVRRSKDFCDFVIINPDKKTENYLDKNKMMFNSYKTAKFYGTQELLVPKPLMSILKKWISINPTKYLLFDTNMNKLTNVKLNQRFNKIFGDKKVSVNNLRHTYLTDKFGDTIAKNKEIDKTMSDMGSSKNMLLTYVKEDT
jgi:integrase